MEFCGLQCIVVAHTRSPRSLASSPIRSHIEWLAFHTEDGSDKNEHTASCAAEGV